MKIRVPVRDFRAALTGVDAVNIKLGNPLESAVQKSCIATCEAHGVMVWRNNSRVFRVPGKGGKDRLMRAGAGNGSADLMAILPGGRFGAIEVKRKGERPTEDQYNWLERVKLAGGVACWADDAARLDEILRRVLKPDGHLVSIGIDRATGEQRFEVRA